jgi:hypothetical protein
MRPWLVLLVASCDGGTPPAKTPAPTIAPVARIPIADAAIDAVPSGAPVDAAPAVPEVDVRASVRAAPLWIGQTNIQQPKIGRDTLVTYELRRDGDQALLVKQGGATSAAYGLADGDPSAAPPSPREWRLSVVERGTTLTFAPLDGSDAALPFVECKRTTLAVVRADAELDVKNENDCGAEPFWKPATKKRVTVLQCDDDLALAAAPGVEWYYMHGDCFQGGGWRALPKQ